MNIQSAGSETNRTIDVLEHFFITLPKKYVRVLGMSRRISKARAERSESGTRSTKRHGNTKQQIDVREFGFL